jgi:hypothetical protein
VREQLPRNAMFVFLCEIRATKNEKSLGIDFIMSNWTATLGTQTSGVDSVE